MSLSKEFDLKEWLESRSQKMERMRDELVFRHDTGLSSILLPRDKWKDGLLPMTVEPLASFYCEYFGASIGNSHLVFATNIEGGLYVSHGFQIPDFNQMKFQALDLGIRLKRSEIVFMYEAAWMFIYSLSVERGHTVLRKHDRDFNGCIIVNGLNDVLENWWKIIVES